MDQPGKSRGLPGGGVAIRGGTGQGKRAFPDSCQEWYERGVSSPDVADLAALSHKPSEVVAGSDRPTNLG